MFYLLSLSQDRMDGPSFPIRAAQAYHKNHNARTMGARALRYVVTVGWLLGRSSLNACPAPGLAARGWTRLR
jgi:hypothetical protein